MHARRVPSCQVSVRIVLEASHPVGLDKVAAQLEEGDKVAGLREAREDEAVADFGVQNNERVALDAAERVADVHDLVEAAPDARDLALAQLVGQGVQRCDLNRGLDLVDAVAVLRLGDAQAVPREGAVAILVRGPRNVCVLVRSGQSWLAGWLAR